MALAFGLMLRLWMLHWVFDVPSDSLNYGGIAKNLLLHGRYALTADGEIYPTLIRLPGYPLFLAACFRVFGMENYWAGACVQIALDLAGCLLLADFTRLAARGVRSGSEGFARRAALATLWLAALCPFTASYTALPLAEAPTLFVLALAMDAMARFRERPRLASAVAFTFAVTAATLLRPDGVSPPSHLFRSCSSRCVSLPTLWRNRKRFPPSCAHPLCGNRRRKPWTATRAGEGRPPLPAEWCWSAP